MSFKTDMFIMTGKGTPEDSVDKYKRDNKGKDLDKEWTYQEVWDELFSSGNVLPQPLTEAHRVVVVDADTLCYRTASGCETRWVETTIGGVKVEFPTKTKLKEYCKKNLVDYSGLIITDHHKTTALPLCLSRLNEQISKLYSDLKATHIVFFIGGSNNFRLSLPLPNLYKGKRINNRRPDHLKACREYLNKNYSTFIINDCEADDVVQGITGYCINNTDAYCLAYNQDKDYHTSLVKNRYYHVVTKEVVELDGGLGHLYMKSNKVKGDGLHWLLCQTMLGDYDDDFSPKPLFKKPYLGNYGDTKYYEDFKSYDNEKELLKAWIDKWKELLPESIEFTVWDGTEAKHDWLSLANLYMKAPYMLTHPNDTTTFSDILERYHLGYLVGRGGYRDGMKQGDICDKIGDGYMVLL